MVGLSCELFKMLIRNIGKGTPDDKMHTTMSFSFFYIDEKNEFLRRAH